jgi:hypothetical protein
MIRESGLTIIPFDDLDDAAERAVELVTTSPPVDLAETLFNIS